MITKKEIRGLLKNIETEGELIELLLETARFMDPSESEEIKEARRKLLEAADLLTVIDD